MRTRGGAHIVASDAQKLGSGYANALPGRNAKQGARSEEVVEVGVGERGSQGTGDGPSLAAGLRPAAEDLGAEVVCPCAGAGLDVEEGSGGQGETERESKAPDGNDFDPAGQDRRLGGQRDRDARAGTPAREARE